MPPSYPSDIFMILFVIPLTVYVGAAVFFRIKDWFAGDPNG